MESIIFNLPYKVKIIEKSMINFSIIILTKNNEKQLKKLLITLENFKENGEILILDNGSNDNTINIATEYGCKVEDGSNFLRIIDEEMSNIINEKFNADNGIVKNGDQYFDYSGARNYIASLASNDMILMLDINSDILYFNISEFERYVNEGYDMIKFNHNKKSVTEFYNRKKFNWTNIVYEILIENEETKKIDTSDSILKFVENDIYTENISDKIIGLSVNCFLSPNDERLSQLFALELYENFLNSSYKEFNRHLTICNYNVYRSITLAHIGNYFMRTGRENEAIEYYHKSYIECSDIRLALYKLGYHFYIKKDWKKSILYLEGCLNIPKIDDVDYDFMYKDGPYSMLYVCYWWIGNPEKGKYYFDKALEIDPFNQLYIDEAIYHYNYIGNTIRGYLSFQQLQTLNNFSKKSKSILEVYPDDPRGTEALLNGFDGIVTVLLNTDKSSFLEKLGNPGNLRIINMNYEDALNYLNDEKFDMVFIHGNDNKYNEILEHNFYIGFHIWEKFASKIFCGSNYNANKNIIDNNFEVLNVNDIWYKNISSFEKTTIYKKKTNL